jgi:hypothetical protein
MTDIRLNFRHPWFVLAAIMGMLLMVSEASASTKPAPRDASRSCCLKRVCTACCCEPASVPTRRETIERSVANRPNGAGLARSPALPCECRSNDPAAPAQKPESRSDDRRSDRDRDDTVELTLDSPPAIPFVRVTLPAASLSKAPLYLRTTHLLI